MTIETKKKAEAVILLKKIDRITRLETRLAKLPYNRILSIVMLIVIGVFAFVFLSKPLTTNALFSYPLLAILSFLVVAKLTMIQEILTQKKTALLLKLLELKTNEMVRYLDGNNP